MAGKVEMVNFDSRSKFEAGQCKSLQEKGFGGPFCTGGTGHLISCTYEI